jgi:hypothetical protein
LLALAPLASCAVPTPPDNCAGWKKIAGAEESVIYLAAHDPDFLRDTITHNLFGRAQHCWE